MQTVQGWQIVDTYDDVISGVKANRPGLNRLMDDARARKFDCLLVWKLDRFGRSLVDCLNNIRALEELWRPIHRRHPGPRHRPAEPSFQIPAGHVLGAAAEFEAFADPRAHQSWAAPATGRIMRAGKVGKTVVQPVRAEHASAPPAESVCP